MNYPPRQCEWCNTEFTPKQKQTRFCSKKCAHKAWEQRNPDYKIKKHDYYLKKRDEYRRRNLDKAAIYSRVWYWKHELSPMKKCENCGSTNKDDLVRHHPDYSKPYETVTLCHKCHSNIHNGEITLEV